MTEPLRLPWSGFHAKNSVARIERSADTLVRFICSRLSRHFNIAGKSARAPLD